MNKTFGSGLLRKKMGLPLFPLLLLFYLPLFGIFFKLFQQEGAGAMAGQLKELLGSPSFLRTLGFTISQAALSAVFSLLLALPGAALFSRYDFPFKKLILSLSFISFILPPILVVLAFVQFWGNQGWVNQFIRWIFPQSQGIHILYSGKAIILAHVFYNLPLALRLIYDGWSSLPHSQEEAAYSLGCSPLKTFRKVIFPQLLPSVGSSLLLIFLYCFLSFAIILVLGGGPRFSTLEVEVYQQIKFSNNYLKGGMIALIEMALGMLLMWSYLKIESRRTLGYSQTLRHEDMKPLAGQGKWLLIIYLLFYMFFLAAPLLAMISKAFIIQRGWNGPREFTLTWFAALFTPGHGMLSLKAILTSLKYALGSTLLVLNISLFLGHQMLRKKILFPRFTEMLILMPLGISSVLLALSYLRISMGLSHNSPLKGLLIIGIHCIIALPLAYRSLVQRIHQLPVNLTEAAQSLGAKPWRLFTKIELPLLKPILRTSALFAFALSMGEVNAVLILSQPGDVTIPLAIYRLMGSYNFNGASAMGTLLIFITMAAFILMEKRNHADRI
ncbi:MAG: iron ABC transporter permease [Spirochaetaceae bacterium]|nr:iron ABC transporter permease [Spirochaetaceae bacterium]